MGRRIISLPLPASDPHSAPILAWLDAQPAGTELAPALRRLLAESLATGSRLAAIEAKLDQLLASGATITPSAEATTSEPPDHQMAVVGHGPRNVTQRYDRSTIRRMRAALVAFEELVFNGLDREGDEAR